jgi:hypothetical protein
MFISIPLSFLWDEKELERLIWLIAPLAIFLLAWWKIYQKAGYPGWLTFLWFIPGVNLIWFLIFAFSCWPIIKKIPIVAGLMASEWTAQAVNDWKQEHQKDLPPAVQ